MRSALQIESAEKNLQKGRQKGAKNKTTLFKEAMREGFENKLSVSAEKVFDVVVEKAIEGDMVAAKMILDRIVPVVDVDKADVGKFNISINVNGIQPEVDVIDGEVIDD